MSLKIFLPMGDKPPDGIGRGYYTSRYQQATAISLPLLKRFHEEDLELLLFPPSSTTSLLIVVFASNAGTNNSSSTWKDLFTKSKHLDNSNSLVSKLRETVSASNPNEKFLDEISKNHGISLFSIVSSEKLQLLHNPSLIGGSRISPEQKLVAILGFDDYARPVEIVLKSLKAVKGKSHSFHEFALGLDSAESFQGLHHPNQEFHYKILIPLPNHLTKIFIALPTTDPVTVTMALYNAIIELYIKDSDAT